MWCGVMDPVRGSAPEVWPIFALPLGWVNTDLKAGWAGRFIRPATLHQRLREKGRSSAPAPALTIPTWEAEGQEGEVSSRAPAPSAERAMAAAICGSEQ